MNNNFKVEKVTNGYVITLSREVKNDEGYYEYAEDIFVFDSEAKLKKGLKLIVETLTKKGE